MTDKHTGGSNAGWGIDGRRLVPVGEAPVVLPATLAGEVDDLTARFAEHMGEGLMAASVTCWARCSRVRLPVWWVRGAVTTRTGAMCGTGRSLGR